MELDDIDKAEKRFCKCIDNERQSLTFDPCIDPYGRADRFTKLNLTESKSFYDDNANRHSYPIFLIARTSVIFDTSDLRLINLNDDHKRAYEEIIREQKKPVFGTWLDEAYKYSVDTVCVEGVDTRFDDSEAEITREQYGQDAFIKIYHDGDFKTLPETRNYNLGEAVGV